MKRAAIAVLALSILAARRADDLVIQDLKCIEPDATSCVVEWTAPFDTSKGSPNGTIESYDFRYTTDPTASWDEMQYLAGFTAGVKSLDMHGGVAPGETVRWTIISLQPGVHYYFQVAAIGNDQEGPPSNIAMSPPAPPVTPAPSPSASPAYTGSSLHASGDGHCMSSAAASPALAIFLAAAAIFGALRRFHQDIRR